MNDAYPTPEQGVPDNLPLSSESAELGGIESTPPKPNGDNDPSDPTHIIRGYN